MNTAVFKQLSRSVIALAAVTVVAGGAMAATQPFNAINATVSIDTSMLTANNISISKIGNAVLSGNTLTLAVSSVTNATNGGAATINFGDNDGFMLTTQFGTLTFKDFSFDAASKTLIGDLQGGGFLLSGISFQDGGLLSAGAAEGNLGFDPLTAVTNSSSARPLYLSASQFTMAAGLAAYLTEKGLTPSTVPVGQIVQNVKIGVSPVPEPSTYALMGLGLVGMALVSRKRRA